MLLAAEQSPQLLLFSDSVLDTQRFLKILLNYKLSIVSLTYSLDVKSRKALLNPRKRKAHQMVNFVQVVALTFSSMIPLRFTVAWCGRNWSVLLHLSIQNCLTTISEKTTFPSQKCLGTWFKKEIH